jgi:HlyD family secretion protein
LAAGAVLAGSEQAPNTDPDQPPPRAKAPDDAKAPPGVPKVRLVNPQSGGLDRVATQACTAEAGRQADLFPAVAGVLKRVDADIGDRVKAGQLLAEIDAPALALDERQAAVGVEQAQGLLKEAEARVATSRFEVEAAKGMVRQREAEVVGARANLDFRKKQFDRVKELTAKEGVTGEGLNEAEGQFRSAQAQVDAAAAGVGTAKANVEAAKVGLEKARLALAQTRTASPFDAVVARRNRSPGDFVRPGERADPTPLFTVMRADVVRVVVGVSERDAVMVEPGLAAEVTFDALPGVRVAGKVARVGFAVDPPNRTVRAEIDLPNPKGAIRPGMSASVTLKLGKGPADALRVPAGAVVGLREVGPGQETDAVYVYRNGKARLTPVRVSYRDVREAEVVSGLTAEDFVVTDPKELLPKGIEVPVEVEKAAPPK